MDQERESRRATRSPRSNFVEIKIKKTPSMKETFPGRLEWKKKHYDKPVTSTPRVTSKSTFSKSDIKECFGFNDSDKEDFDYSSYISPIPRLKLPKSDNNKANKKVDIGVIVAETEKKQDNKKVAEEKKQGNNNKVAEEKKNKENKKLEKENKMKAEEEKLTFSQLLNEYGKKDEVEEEAKAEGLYIDPKQIHKTYANTSKSKEKEKTPLKKKKTVTIKQKTSIVKPVKPPRAAAAALGTRHSSRVRKVIFSTLNLSPSPSPPPKKPKRTKKKEIIEKAEKKEIKEWIEEKNKEFEDISAFPLVIE